MSAIFSDCGTYRYRLERTLRDDHGPVMAFIMVNPSTADAEADDPTIRKCVGFAKLHGAERLIVGNKFAFQATDVKKLRRARDPVGPDNDKHLYDIIGSADIVFVAWGSLNKLPETLRGRWKDIVRIADSIRQSGGGPIDLWTLGFTGDGHPRHPLMTAYDTPCARWNVPWFANRSSAPRSDGKQP